MPVKINGFLFDLKRRIVDILQDQPSLWSCPTGPLSIFHIRDRSLQCRALCGTVSQCLSTPQRLYWPTRAAPTRETTTMDRVIKCVAVAYRLGTVINKYRWITEYSGFSLPDSFWTPHWTCSLCDAAGRWLGQSSCTCGRAKDQIRLEVSSIHNSRLSDYDRWEL